MVPIGKRLWRKTSKVIFVKFRQITFSWNNSDSNVIFRETGLMVFGKRNQPYFDGVVKSLEINKMDFKLYNPDELGNSYQNLTMGPNVWGCYDPSGGVLMADKCLKAVWVFFDKKKYMKK